MKKFAPFAAVAVVAVLTGCSAPTDTGTATTGDAVGYPKAAPSAVPTAGGTPVATPSATPSPSPSATPATTTPKGK